MKLYILVYVGITHHKLDLFCYLIKFRFCFKRKDHKMARDEVAFSMPPAYPGSQDQTKTGDGVQVKEQSGFQVHVQVPTYGQESVSINCRNCYHRVGEF